MSSRGGSHRTGHTRTRGVEQVRWKGLTFYQILKAKAKFNARKRYEHIFGSIVYCWSDKKIDREMSE